METILLGPVTYVIDNPTAALLMKQAATAFRAGNMDSMRELRRLAAQVEAGRMDAEAALAASEPLAAAA